MTADDNTASKNYHRRIAEELKEADDPIVKGQLILDRWVQSQRDLAAEEARLERELNPTGLKIW
jgi:hypothetical protein